MMWWNRSRNNPVWAATVLLVLACAAGIKAAPPHDGCSSAIVVTAGVPYSDTTVGATGSDLSSCALNDTLDVWHRFTPTTTGQVLISLCGSSFDTTLSVFDGCGGAELACNDDFCGLESELMVGLAGGQPYYIRVAGFGGDTGNYTLSITEIPPPPHDECVNAIAVAENTPYEGTTMGATGTATSSCASGDALDVWHEFTPAVSGLYTFSLCGSLFDTTLSVFDGCGGTELACNDDYDYCDLQSKLSMSLSEGNVYYIRVAGYDGETGDYTLTVTEEVCESPNEPNGPNPAWGAVDISTDMTLSWNGVNKSIKESKSHLMPKVIYGADDRMDEYEVSDPDLLAVGDATVALVSMSDLADNGDGTYSLSVLTFAEWYELSGRPLCPDEPYLDQPNPAWCSGFLVAPDIVATAGHCVTNPGECSDTAFVFGFVMLDATTPVLTIDASQVYFCSEIIARQQTAADWGLIRLDREVTDHAPLPVRRTGKVEDGAEALVIGHPVGLPRKYAGGATVRDNSEPEYFQANVDTYGGNSGSAVFDANTLLVEGILVRGNADFVQDGSCDRSNVCPDTGCPWWEDVTRATEFSSLIPCFDVYLGTAVNDLSLVCVNSVEAGCDPGPLECGTTYYWQVIGKNHCGQTTGPLWWFRTDPSGDMDQDCDVDLPDFSAWSAHWNEHDCDAGNNWCDGADLGGDRTVDFNDLGYLASRWLTGK